MAKVLIYSPHPFGKSLAGASIRALELAKSLAYHHRVILMAPGEVSPFSEQFESYSFEDRACKKQFKDADLLITQRLTVPLALLASYHGINVIIDAYDPSPFELLEYYKRESSASWYKKIRSETTTLAFSFHMADGILCASDKQRELWLGFLLAQKLITPNLYARDPSLRDFLSVVPFGLSSIPPVRNGQGLREKFGLHPNDKILLWGGGIWNWFDPLSLIHAMKILSAKRTDIKLIFMGVKPPHPSLPSMSIAREAIQLAQKFHLIDHTIFFHQEWVPYEERQNFLLDADIGISTHFEHLETCFSFRTRILDYLWAELPIISTMGDSFAELIERHQLGNVVPYQNEKAIASAILNLLDDPNRMLEIKKNIRHLQKQFYWQSVTVPLLQMIERLVSLPRPHKKWQTSKALMRFLFHKIPEKGVIKSFNKLFKSICGRQLKKFTTY